MLRLPGTRNSRIDTRLLAGVAVLSGLGALAGCSAGNTSTKTISVDNQLLGYHHRSDLPWGVVPICPPQDEPIVGQLSLQGGASTLAEVEANSKGTWNPSKLQGTAELNLISRNARMGIGGRVGAEPSVWLSLGIMERGDGATHLYGEAAAGVEHGHSTVDYRSVRTETESGSVKRDTTLVHIEPEQWRGFTRLTFGLIPAESGPWGLVQVIPSWKITQWSKGYQEIVKTTTYEDTSMHPRVETERTGENKAQESALLVGFGAGWTQRLDAKTLTVGARYSAKQLHQLELLVQFTSEL